MPMTHHQHADTQGIREYTVSEWRDSQNMAAHRHFMCDRPAQIVRQPQHLRIGKTRPFSASTWATVKWVQSPYAAKALPNRVLRRLD